MLRGLANRNVFKSRLNCSNAMLGCRSEAVEAMYLECLFCFKYQTYLALQYGGV